MSSPRPDLSGALFGIASVEMVYGLCLVFRNDKKAGTLRQAQAKVRRIKAPKNKKSQKIPGFKLFMLKL